ncbi:hypothetical protein [Aquabacterium humicola]|uniref:hypothetical protein n=1 Tax=Aquabacterium humicola TaxID=3237377 RepID=UPI002542989D|nr:hypothetical protein [Rubrivivax pictus]
MSADPPSFIADVAAQVVAWHNRHPLARRIARKDVQSVGIVALPFAREAQPAWHAVPPKRGLLALMFPKRVNLKPWPVFSEDALPEIGPKKLSAFALRHGFVERPGPPELPERVLQTDRDLVDAPRGDEPPERLSRYLVTAAIDIGPARPRLVLGHGRRMPVLGQRLWSVPRLAALGGGAMVSLLVGAAALWLVATQQRAADVPPAARAPASAASTPAPRAAPPAVAASLPPPAPPVAAASVPPAPPVASAAAPASAAVVVPARPSAPPPPVAGASPAAAPSPAASASPPPVAAARPRPGPAPSPAASVASPAASVTSPAPAPPLPPAQTLPTTPPSPPLAEAQRASAPLVPRLKPDLAEAARAEREKHPNLPQLGRPATPPAAGSATAPGAVHFYALVTRPIRSRAEAEGVLKRLRAETSRIAHPTAIETGLQQTPEGWRVTWWPFTHPRQAENARAALAARGVPLEMVEF